MPDNQAFLHPILLAYQYTYFYTAVVPRLYPKYSICTPLLKAGEII